MGDFLDVPMMIGTNKDEGTMYPMLLMPEYFDSPTPPYISRTQYESFVALQLERYRRGGDIVEEATFQEYTDWTTADDPAADYFRSEVDFAGDIDNICPSDKVMRLHADNGGTVYKYFMTHEPSK